MPFQGIESKKEHPGLKPRAESFRRFAAFRVLVYTISMALSKALRPDPPVYAPLAAARPE
jgi:hypothetical protein